MQYVFLSHDVDWRKSGPPKEHILARKDRFDNSVLDNIDTINPYYNIPEIMSIEEKYGIKSTFFFRTKYEDGDFNDYEKDLNDLSKGGWEIGLHSSPSSVNNIEKIQEEKENLESLSGTQVLGNRVHFLCNDENFISTLDQSGFSYDSSMRHTKDRIDNSEMGFAKLGGVIEFPVTLMDAYLFTYMKIPEEQIVPTFERTLDYSRNLEKEFGIITVLWHDNVLKMKGGRIYKKIIDFLVSQDDVKICTGIELTKIINR